MGLKLQKRLKITKHIKQKIMSENNNELVLVPGMHVTVLKWKNRIEYSWVGLVMKVMEVNDPFVVVKLDKLPSSTKKKVILDRREVELIELSDAFVVASRE